MFGFFKCDKEPQPHNPPQHSSNLIIYAGEKHDSIHFTLDEKVVIEITPRGFVVNGVPVEQGPGEAQQVYDAFMRWQSLAPYPFPNKE